MIEKLPDNNYCGYCSLHTSKLNEIIDVVNVMQSVFDTRICSLEEKVGLYLTTPTEPTTLTLECPQSPDGKHKLKRMKPYLQGYEHFYCEICGEEKE